MRPIHVSLAIVLCAAVPACTLVDGSSGDDDVLVEPDVNYPDSLHLGGNWTRIQGPCPGSETNALWFDSRQKGFAGCGQNADGAGLYVTSDGGRTWAGLPEFAEVRVNDIRRGPDKTLYGAGFHRVLGYSAFKVDETGELKPEGLFEPGNNAFVKVAQGENIAIAQDGQMLVDSLTGVTAAYQPAGGEFAEFECLGQEALSNPEAPGFQVRRIQSIDNRFYATGSLINMPGMVYLPSKLAGATYHMQAFAMQNEKEDGELLDMHLWSAERMIVVGIDQSYSRPLILLSKDDPYVMGNWTRIDVRDSGIDYQAGINDVHVNGEIVVAAGEKVPTVAGGMVLISADGGKTWSDITPKDEAGNPGALSKVWRFEDGDMVVAGGGYEMWIYEAP